MLLKKILLTIGLAAGLIFSGHSHAQAAPEGPFQNVDEVIAAWTQYVPFLSATVAVDGQTVYKRSGGGPARGGWYYTCPSDGLIRMNCPTEGPFQNTNTIIDYWSQTSTGGAALYIFVDGSLVYQRFGFGPGTGKSYVFCPKRPGGGYMTNCSL